MTQVAAEWNRGKSRADTREQAYMSTRWMPWRLKPKKDVETDETFRGRGNHSMNPEIPNGATHPE